MSGVGLITTRGTCETSQALLVVVPGGFSQGGGGSLDFSPPIDWPVSYELK